MNSQTGAEGLCCASGAASVSNGHSRCSSNNAYRIREPCNATGKHRTFVVASSIWRNTFPRPRKSAPRQISGLNRASYNLRARMGQSTVLSTAWFRKISTAPTLQAQQHPDEKSLWPKTFNGELAGFNRRFLHSTFGLADCFIQFRLS